jgi:hypothetical protein
MIHDVQCDKNSTVVWCSVFAFVGLGYSVTDNEGQVKRMVCRNQDENSTTPTEPMMGTRETNCLCKQQTVSMLLSLNEWTELYNT